MSSGITITPPDSKQLTFAQYGYSSASGGFNTDTGT